MSTDTTTHAIPVETFRSALLSALDEVFVGTELPYTTFTDKGASIFETLRTIDAGTASRTFSERAGNIAAQVNHVRFHLDVLMDGLRNGFGPADWEGSWKVGAVDAGEWQDLIDRLQQSFEETRAFAAGWVNWNADFVSGAFGLIGHAAYHLGEIRSSLAALQVPA